MKLMEIVKIVDGKVINFSDDINIEDITNNSKEVKRGSLFIAIEGNVVDGHNFIDDAIKNGAVAIILSKWSDRYSEVPLIVVPDCEEASLKIAAPFYNFPSKRMKVIGITGTNGKTTTTYMIESILKEAGFNPGVIGTIENRYGGRSYESQNTSPHALKLQKILSDMEKADVTHVIMEVSSHAIKLKRIIDTYFDLVIFTNLTVEHTEFHKDMEDYFKTKSELFEEDKNKKKICIINREDEYGRRLFESINIEKYSIGLDDNNDIYAHDILIDNGMNFTISGNDVEEFKVAINLSGEFNVLNSLGAIASTLKLGIAREDIISGLKKLEFVPGRFENVARDFSFDVIVDYAHTPAGLENLLNAARKVSKNRVITIFGCGGDRSRDKRPIMGEIAGRLSDYSILTSDNPRTEDPMSIIEDVMPGLKKSSKNYIVESDRRRAIKSGIEMASEGDIVVIAGKGHEDYQIIGRKKYHFDDREIAKEELNILNKRENNSSEKV